VKEGQYWDSVAQRRPAKNGKNQIYVEHKRATYLKLLEKWVDADSSPLVLKTDLFDESFYCDPFLSKTSWSLSTVGIDISFDIVSKARKLALWNSIGCSNYVCCDVKALPFRDDCFDYVISDSTLDHFPSEVQIITALENISRVLKTGAVLVLVMDNKTNITYTPYFFIRLWMWLGLTPYFVGRTLSLKKLKRVLGSLNLDVEDSTAIFHYPHPDMAVRGLESLIHRICGDRLNNVMRWIFASLERLEKRRTKYLTGRYIALRAIKQEKST
jgi:SAM-dependent methyltransferase